MVLVMVLSVATLGIAEEEKIKIGFVSAVFSMSGATISQWHMNPVTKPNIRS